MASREIFHLDVYHLQKEIMQKRKLTSEIHEKIYKPGFFFCLLLLYYMLKISFPEYYLYSIVIPYILHRRSHLGLKFTIRLITSSRGSTKNDVYPLLFTKNFIFYKITYYFFFSNAIKATGKVLLAF